MSKVYQVITDRILQLLDAGVAPWRKAWSGGASGMPTNLISGKPYRGVNVWLLAARGYASPYWLTFKQAKRIGGHVRKGEKSTPVVFWKKYQSKGEPDPQNPDDDGKRTRLVLRYYNVFNVAQCEIPEAKLPADATPDAGDDFDPIESAAAIVEGWTDCPPIRHGGGRACYSPVLDTISMPDAGAFDPPEEYYSTLYHEMGHATGHASRLGRLDESIDLRFGSHDYSREELVAEMTAAYLSGVAGIEQATIENSAAYIAGWRRKLQGDPKCVVIAAAQAQKAADMILGATFESKED